jgi:PAS domain S-box-containing protein
MVFKERYVVTRVGVTVAQPAWVCGCGVDTYVRTIVNVTRHRSPVERRLARVDLLRDTLEMRHALAYICEQAQLLSAMTMRDRARHAIAELQRVPTIGILAADDSGRFIAANDAACSLTGYSHAELFELSVWDLSPKRNVGKWQRTWRHFLRERGFDGEYHLRRNTGEGIEVRCMAAANIIPGLHVATVTLRRDTAR